MADDYAGSTSTIGTVSVGGSRSANIETAGDTDWFRITLQAGYTYQFDMLGSATGNGTLSDPFMRIRDSAGNSLASDDDTGSGLNARISSFTASYSGTYYISAGSSTASGIGTYRVTATQTGTPTTDTTAPLLSSFTPADNSAGVAVGANLVLNFNETVRAGTGNIIIYYASGTAVRTIAVTDTTQVSFSGSTMTVNPASNLAAGTGYYVHMASGVVRDIAGNNFAGISSTTAFNFTTASGTTSDAGNTLATATALTLGITRTESVGVGTDTNDYFRFTATANGRVTANLTGLSADIDLRALNSAGTQIVAGEAGGTASESIGFNVVAGQTYYLRVDPYGAVSSNYALATSFSPTTPEVTVLGNAVSIADGDTTPTATDHTNFGSVAIGSAGVTRTFTVRNDGNSTLTLSNLTLPTGFTLVNGLVTSLAPGATDTFQVRMDATTAGTKTGQITFTSNDPNESPFNFTITGTVTGTTTDAGNTLATATALTLGNTVSQSVGISPDSDDYFSFTAASTGRVTAKLTGLSADIDLRALNSAGTEIDASVAGSAATGSTASEFVSFNVVAGQTYYLRVDPEATASSNYSLATTFTPSTTPQVASSFRLPFTNLSLTQEYGVPGALTDLPTYKHLGEDYGGALGSSILAAANGKVIAAVNTSPTTGFGNYAIIEHTLPDQTKVYSLYGHMSYVNAKVGDVVRAGDQIGIIGETGTADGRHLHLEISIVNKFNQAGMFGKGYDSPTEWNTSSHYTYDPSNFIGGARFGNSSSNTLTGSTGDNFFFGGLGNDTVTSGSGYDTFVFSTAIGPTNVDTITDFSVDNDTVLLSRAIFSSAGALGKLAAGAFNTGAAASDASDRIMYNSTTGAVIYDSDGNGVGVAVQFATLGTGLTLTSADFFLF